MYNDFMFDEIYGDNDWELEEETQSNNLDAYGNIIPEFPW